MCWVIFCHLQAWWLVPIPTNYGIFKYSKNTTYKKSKAINYKSKFLNTE